MGETLQKQDNDASVRLVYCPACNHPLFRIIGSHQIFAIEVRCVRCHADHRVESRHDFRLDVMENV